MPTDAYGYMQNLGWGFEYHSVTYDVIHIPDTISDNPCFKEMSEMETYYYEEIRHWPLDKVLPEAPETGADYRERQSFFGAVLELTPEELQEHFGIEHTTQIHWSKHKNRFFKVRSFLLADHYVLRFLGEVPGKFANSKKCQLFRLHCLKDGQVFDAQTSEELFERAWQHARETAPDYTGPNRDSYEFDEGNLHVLQTLRRKGQPVTKEDCIRAGYNIHPDDPIPEELLPAKPAAKEAPNYWQDLLEKGGGFENPPLPEAPKKKPTELQTFAGWVGVIGFAMLLFAVLGAG